MAENERTFPRTVALIGLAGTLGAAAITAFITVAANDHGTPPPSPSATAPTPSSSSAAGPANTDTVVATRTPVSGSPTPASTPPASTPPAAGGATVSGVPRQSAPGRQVTMRASGFPSRDTIKVAYNLGPGQDWPLSASPVRTDAQGSFTVTFTVLDIFCGYDGQMVTYDQGGDGHLLTSSPLAVVC